MIVQILTLDMSMMAKLVAPSARDGQNKNKQSVMQFKELSNCTNFNALSVEKLLYGRIKVL